MTAISIPFYITNSLSKPNFHLQPAHPGDKAYRKYTWCGINANNLNNVECSPLNKSIMAHLTPTHIETTLLNVRSLNNK